MSSLLTAWFGKLNSGGGGTGKGLPGKVVDTKGGKLEGTMSQSRDGRPVYKWLGIQYGQVNRRFETAVPVDPWTGVREAKQFGPKCAQLAVLTRLFEGQEDKLFLNVYVPKDALDAGKSLPVLVFIHGGAFAIGSSDQYRPNYFMDHDVVFVSINYRLGPLGFLNVGDKNARGNQGLKDQALALKWVKENISVFGGDANRITLFGESAGAGSAHFHILSPMSRGIVSRVISQSGNVLCPWVVNSDPLTRAKNLAQSLNIPTDDTEKMVEGLRAVEVQALLRAVRSPNAQKGEGGIPFGPSVETIVDEETFLSLHPEELIQSGQFDQIPFMTGVNADEGLLFTHFYLSSEKFRGAAQQDWASFCKGIVGLTPEEIEHAQKVREFYIGPEDKVRLDGPPDDKLFRALTDLMTDRSFLQDGVRAAELQAGLSSQPVYFYYYKMTAGPSIMDIITSIQRKYPILLEFAAYKLKNFLDRFGMGHRNYGVSHADELVMLFHWPELFKLIGPNDQHYKFSKDFVQLWVDFACGEKSLEFRNVKFEPVQKGDFKYLEIDDQPKFTSPVGSVKDRIEFWKQLWSTNLQAKI